MNHWDVLTFGEPLVNFVAENEGPVHDVVHFIRSLGGAETNVAVGLSRLQRSVALITQLGSDILGDYTISVLQKEGVDVSLITRGESEYTGYQFKTKAIKGDPEIHYCRRNSAASKVKWRNSLIDAIREASHVHLTGIPLALSNSTRAVSAEILEVSRQYGIPVTFDPNLRPVLWSSEHEMVTTVNKYAVLADIVMPGIREGQILTGFQEPRDIAGFYLNKEVRLVIVKLGPEGAYYRSHEEEGIVAGFTVPKVVDTVGAGDGFAVGVIDALLDGLPVREAVRHGCAVGAMAVMSEGDLDGLPNITTLSAFMNSNLGRMSTC